MTNIRSLVDNITAGDNVSAAEKISDIMAEKLQTLLDLAKIEVAQGMFNTCEECEEPMLTQEQYDLLSDEEKADYEEIDEALVGNQKKIDANKNGKLDAQDFKMLRAKKGMKEEVEEVTEIKKDTLKNYVSKAAVNMSASGFKGDAKKVAKRAKGIGAATAKMKEEVEVDEAYTDPYAAKKAAEMKKAHAATMADAKKEYDAAKKPKFAKNFMKMKKEEVEQVDELNTQTYKNAAIKRIKQSEKVLQHPKLQKHFVDRANKLMAHSDLKKANVSPATQRRINKEEVEQVDEVITKKTPTGEVISDFVHSKNPMFKGKSKKERIRMALGAKYAMMKKEEVALDEGNAENKAKKNAVVKKMGDANPQHKLDHMGMPEKSGHSTRPPESGVKGGRIALKKNNDPLANNLRSGMDGSKVHPSWKKLVSKNQNAAVKKQPKPNLP